MASLVAKAKDGRVWVAVTDELCAMFDPSTGTWTGDAPSPTEMEEDFRRVMDEKEASAYLEQALKAAASNPSLRM